jgi:hypothetical protein
MAARKNTVKENRAAMAELRALQGRGAAPGAFSPSRVHGRYATATVGGVTLHLFDYEITFNMETFDATAHGEWWKVMVQGDQSWTMRCRGYFTSGTATYLAAAGVSGADPTAVTVNAYGTMDTDGTPAPIWTAAGFITRANFAAPMAMVVQEMEITGSGTPSAGI